MTTPLWVNVRTVTGAFLMLLALFLGQRALARAETTVEMWAASRDLPQGAVLDSSSLKVTSVRLPEGSLEAYVAANSDPIGTTLARPLKAGELLPVSAVSEREGGAERSMSIPIKDGLIPGDLAVGDRVDVYATFVNVRRPYTVQVLHSAEVIELLSSGSSAFVDGGVSGLTLAVDKTEASETSFAIHTAAIDVVKVTGTEGSSDPGRVDGGDLR